MSLNYEFKVSYYNYHFNFLWVLIVFFHKHFFCYHKVNAVAESKTILDYYWALCFARHVQRDFLNIIFVSSLLLHHHYTDPFLLLLFIYWPLSFYGRFFNLNILSIRSYKKNQVVGSLHTFIIVVNKKGWSCKNVLSNWLKDGFHIIFDLNLH